MKITFDKEADAAYIYIEEETKEGASVKTIEVNEDIILDFDKDDKLLGIEILNASKNISREFLLGPDVENLVSA